MQYLSSGGERRMGEFQSRNHDFYIALVATRTSLILLKKVIPRNY